MDNFVLNDYKSKLEDWVRKDISEPEGCLDFLNKFGKALCDTRNGAKAITSSQMRNIYTEIKRIQAHAQTIQLGADIPSSHKLDATVKAEFLLLMPKLAYTKARFSSVALFYSVFEILHKQVSTYKQLDNLCQIMEGILAYHKVYGGRD